MDPCSYASAANGIGAWPAMAIKFVDVEPEGENPKRAKQADAPPAGREPDAEALKESVDPELTHPKAEPKQRGRKKPLR